MGYTTVTGQVLDPAGSPYALGTFTITLVMPAGVSSYPAFIGGGFIPASIAGGSLDASGNLPTLSLPDNATVDPAGTKWQFNIVSHSGLIGFSAQITITGVSQSVTTALQASAALLAAPTFTTGTGFGMIMAPSSRPAGAYAYLVALNDAGGSSSGLMTGGAAQKTYALCSIVNRPSGSGASGDSNDAGLYVRYNNYAVNDTNFVMRGVNSTIANRSGGTVGNLFGGLISASSKSGSTTPLVRGLEVGVENFGTNATEHSGIDITLKNEGTKATLEYGIRIRNLNNSLTTANDAAIIVGTSSGLTNTGFTYGLDFNGATLAFEYRSSNGVTLKKKGTDTWDGLTITKTTSAAPDVSADGVGLLVENNKTSGSANQCAITAVEGVARARAAGVETTLRGGHFRNYIDETLSGSAITCVGVDGSSRASGAIAPQPGTAFIGVRAYMAPGFTAMTNVTNCHAFWGYNEHATNAITNGLYLSDGGGGFNYGVNLSGVKINTADIQLSNGQTLASVTAGKEIDIFDSAQATAGGTNKLYVKVESLTNALTGDQIGVRGRSNNKVNTMTGACIGGQFQAANYNASAGGTIRGAFIEALTKGVNIGIVRGLEVNVDEDGGETITTEIGAGRFQVQTADTSTWSGSSYGIKIINSETVGAGKVLDAMIEMNSESGVAGASVLINASTLHQTPGVAGNANYVALFGAKDSDGTIRYVRMKNDGTLDTTTTWP